jgi:hypothetical protein
VSFQLTILKVLVGHPDGRASLADLRHAVAILMSSGPDWTERMKRLALRVPDLDIFGSKLVSRDNAGWQITEAGREFLLSLETKPSAVRPPEPPTEVRPTPAPPPLLFVGPKRRRRQRRARRAADRARRGGAA